MLNYYIKGLVDISKYSYRNYNHCILYNFKYKL